MKQVYHVEFIGGIRITNLDPVGYKVDINLDHSESPISIMADLPDDEFVEFIKKEIRTRGLNRVAFTRATKLPP
jgi:hypothetical protein